MVKKRLISIITALMLLVTLTPVAAFAQDSVTLDAISTKAPGDSVTISGTTTLDEVTIKVIRPDQTIMYVDVATAANRTYTNAFKLPIDAVTGEYTVVVGQGNVVATGTFTVQYRSSGGSSGGGGGGVSTQPVSSTTGSATVMPSAGGTVGLGNEASVSIPANALQGTSGIKVSVQKVDTPPAAPSGFVMLGVAYQFKVGDEDRYNFNKPVTLTFAFDPDRLAPGQEPAVYYYDEATQEWVSIGGTVSGNIITVTVDHFTIYAVMAKEKALQPPVEKPEIALTDIAGHWAENNIKTLVEAGAISGYPDGTFRPDNKITRAEFATVLVKALKLSPQSGKVFNDTAGHWARDFIATVAANGIVSGYSDTQFGPDDNITREQMAVMIVKAAQLNVVSGGKNFADKDRISAWAKDAVATASENNIITGYSDNTFRPGDSATRAEAVTVIVKLLK